MLLAACGESAIPAPDDDPQQIDAVEVPELGVCRVLGTDDIAQPTDATQTVPCSQRHTAQTYAVGTLPPQLGEAAYDAPEVASYAYDTCSSKLRTFLGSDESLALRTILTWAWFRPSEKAWGEGARWYRCDVVGGSEESASLVKLPENAQGVLQGRPDDRWLVCVAGDSVTGAPRIPCSRKHDWRAATTIKVGESAEDYPGDRQVEVTTRTFCSDSIGAWLNYPVEYDYAYTWFHEAEWDSGNRRSVCWARTPD